MVVPYREEMAKRHLKVTGDLGRVTFMVWPINEMEWFKTKSVQEFDLRNTQSIEESIRHSDVVYNLIGRDYPTKSVWHFSYLIVLTQYEIRNFTLEDVHVEGAERIAEAVAKYDIDRFIHASSFNSDVKSSSEFFRTKVLMPRCGCNRGKADVDRQGVRLL